ncbi:MAG TPA: crossover junction endodeoxyribonuclease RuvC [Gammaproteobacteria bacterium]|uniref:crossover junction endodeoxyribonuclease RuvC n=1 Tax=Immundisolibacter sp. TaxID=1934948 RepID=UPI000E8A09FA|nr:crossover junction endodeoxyribonuclease RuvC [Gammaproteobacteria bacterium]HCZ48685.1 crossover junction endodeoxyribonuclease RuvC [Gammaproteobacteria bacterium]MCH78123.1 crossover junction endodeoxyribonuclease RuvC [Gammaproteobacteria bacterium]
MTRILGIDPGSRLTGFGLIDIQRGGARYVESGVIRVPPGALDARLGTIFNGISELLAEFRPDAVAIESVFVQRNVASALKLGQARGAAIVAAAVAGVPVSEYSPAEIKQRVVGNGRAGKEQVQYMVGRLLSLAVPPRADAADALAGALCHAHSVQLPRAGARAR